MVFATARIRAIAPWRSEPDRVAPLRSALQEKGPTHVRAAFQKVGPTQPPTGPGRTPWSTQLCEGRRRPARVENPETMPQALGARLSERTQLVGFLSHGKVGAGSENRTRDIQLGKLTFYL
jgi:hypothetical protein